MHDLATTQPYAEREASRPPGAVAQRRRHKEPADPRCLRELVADYLRGQDGWREHPEYAGTHLQWEDLHAAPDEPNRRLSTKLAATRQMLYESRR
jgi:hypothetical protein